MNPIDEFCLVNSINPDRSDLTDLIANAITEGNNEEDADACPTQGQTN